VDRDLLDLYGCASEWTGTKVGGAVQDLDAPTICDGWNVRTLMNHMLATQKYFFGSARGDDVSLSREPPDLLSDDPCADFKRARAETLRTIGAPASLSERDQPLASRSATGCSTAGIWPSLPDKPPPCPKACLKLLSL
jgi:hypothetical protein